MKVQKCKCRLHRFICVLTGDITGAETNTISVLVLHITISPMTFESTFKNSFDLRVR
jgi:hypothetical protein